MSCLFLDVKEETIKNVNALLNFNFCFQHFTSSSVYTWCTLRYLSTLTFAMWLRWAAPSPWVRTNWTRSNGIKAIRSSFGKSVIINRYISKLCRMPTLSLNSVADTLHWWISKYQHGQSRASIYIERILIAVTSKRVVLV